MKDAFLAGFDQELAKLAQMSSAAVKAKIKAPRTGDTGPPGKGLADPRVKMQQRLMAKRGR